MTLPHPQWVNRLAFSPDGNLLATADDDMLLRLWNPHTGQNTATLRGHNSVVECVAFSPDGKLIASGGKTGEIKLWDTATAREIATLRAPDADLVWWLAFSSDGKSLAVAEGRASSMVKPHSVVVWDISQRRVVVTLPGHKDHIETV
ncbi:MAG: WD40 repeat domain-containing protein [Chthoniobacterales bacterium]